MSTQLDLRKNILAIIFEQRYTNDGNNTGSRLVAYSARDKIMSAFADYLEGIELPEKQDAEWQRIYQAGKRVQKINDPVIEAQNDIIDQTHTIINSHVSKLRGTK